MYIESIPVKMTMQALHVVYSFVTIVVLEPKYIVQEFPEHPIHVINGLEDILKFLPSTSSSIGLGFLECQMCIVVKLWGSSFSFLFVRLRFPC